MKKNSIRKWYCVICALLIVLSLAGCGGNGTASRNTAGSPDAAGQNSGAAAEDTTAAQATAAETQPAQTTEARTQQGQAATAGNQPDASPSQPAAAQSQGQGQGITEADAKQIALSHADVSESDAAYMKVKLERDHGRDEYDVEFYAGNTEYDYEIDAVTGEILSFDYDAESYTPPAGQNQTGSGAEAGSQNQGKASYITPDQAKTAAFTHANVSEGDAAKLKVEFDQDHGRAEYDVEFDVGNTEYEYEIDAVTGEVISYETDHD